MREWRPLGAECLADLQADAGVALLAVPIAPVAFHLAERARDLIGRGLDFLETHDVRPLARDPLLQLRLPGANPVYVPGRDLHHVPRYHSDAHSLNPEP